MRALHVLLVLMPLFVAQAAWAQRSPAVVELYTSQGCSACPPADAILAELAQRPGVIALALHVDYWDYLGWKDSFGQAAHSKRQRAYAKAVRERSIYTPQMIVQGVDRVVGADRYAVLRHLAAHQARPAPVEIGLDRRGGALRVSLAPAGPAGVGASDIHVVRFIPGETVAIERGENAGHSIDYVNVVTDWASVGHWDGRSVVELAFAVPEAAHVAVIVQRERLGPILSAAKLP